MLGEIQLSEFVKSAVQNNKLETTLSGTELLYAKLLGAPYDSSLGGDALLAAVLFKELIRLDPVFSAKLDGSDLSVKNKMEALVLFFINRQELVESEIDPTWLAKLKADLLDMSYFKKSVVSIMPGDNLLLEGNIVRIPAKLSAVYPADELILFGACLYMGLPIMGSELLLWYQDHLDSAVTLQSLSFGVNNSLYAEVCKAALVSGISVKELSQCLEHKYNDFNVSLSLGAVVLTDPALDLCTVIPVTSSGMHEALVINSVTAEGLIKRGIVSTLIVSEDDFAKCVYKGEEVYVHKMFGLKTNNENKNCLFE